MKRLVLLLLLLVVSHAFELLESVDNEVCRPDRSLNPRPHSVSILEFGAVGDGNTLNTVAFQNAIFYLKSFADKGGAQLYVPAGRWLTGSFNLTSHLTLFLEKEAVILASQDYDHWRVVDPLPSYGRGMDIQGVRYRSLITGDDLIDVAITGENGTIDGQGSVWWEKFSSHSLNYSRPHIVEFIGSKDIVISNITFLNPPAWTIRPVYCSNVLIQNVTGYSPPESPGTTGIVPDSSETVCIENSNISMGYDAIVMKSGWDEYGISYGKPTTNVHIRNVLLQSASGSCVAFGSEMSGGISDIIVEHVHIRDSLTGIELKTAKGRGGYIKDILISDVDLTNVRVAIKATGQFDTHPDDGYDHQALPVVKGITFKDMVGTNIVTAGNFSGILESPFSVCLSNITFSVTSHPSSSWICSNVLGFSENVSPEPCPELQASSSNSSTCYSFTHRDSYFADL